MTQKHFFTRIRAGRLVRVCPNGLVSSPSSQTLSNMAENSTNFATLYSTGLGQALVTLLTCCGVWLGTGRGSAQPANDSFANRLQLTGTNITNSVSNTGATAETGEPSHNGTNAALSSIW